MNTSMTSPTKRLLVAMGLSCAFATAGMAESANQAGIHGSMSALQFDGTYKGVSQPVVAHDSSCPAAQEVVVQVHDARLTLPWNDRQSFEARIARNGTFFATTGSMIQAEKHMTMVPTLQGHIGAAGLAADYGTRLCRYRLQATQLPAVQHFSQAPSGINLRQ